MGICFIPQGNGVVDHDLDRIRTFVRVVERGTFSAVAREAGIGQPAVSKKVAALEEHVGVQLLLRGASNVRLTDAGQEFYDSMVRVLDELDSARARVGGGQVDPSGVVRLSMTPFLGRTYVVPRLAELFESYPRLAVDLRVSERTPNLVEEGLDVAVHTGELPDSTLIARRIAETPVVSVATPGYLATYGQPRHPADLAEHRGVVFTPFGAPSPWRFQTDAGLVRHAPTGSFRTDDAEAIRAAVLAGLGIGVAPEWLFAREMSTGEVAWVLRAFAPPPLPVSAVLQAGRRVPMRVRVVVEFLERVFKEDAHLRARAKRRRAPPTRR
jgi:LysR family transcriptional regulator for bpeEF and oprC